MKNEFNAFSDDLLPKKELLKSEKGEQDLKYIRKLEEVTEELKKDYPKTVGNLTRIAEEVGFGKVLFDSSSGDIGVRPDKDKDAVFFPVDGLEHQQLLEKIDEDFVDKATRIMMLHEMEHLKNPADKAADKCDERNESFVRTRNEDQQLENISPLDNPVESQTNLQMIVKNPKEFEKIIDAIAKESVYVNFIYDGVRSLEQKTNAINYFFYDENYNFLKPDTIDKVIEREDEIKKELLNKYNKLLELESNKMSREF